MKTRNYALIALLLMHTQAIFAMPTESEIKAILQNRIDVEERAVGIAVGLIDKNGRTYVSHGTFTKDRDKQIDENTIFEIGSISKVYTTTLLMDMVSRGEVNLDDPIAKHLPKSVTVPTRDDKQITLEHLATHTSGLPRLPSNMDMKNRNNPYASYTAYSNYGMGLLGHILALKSGTGYEELLTDQITTPLGMPSTAITLSPDLKNRLATGHNPGLEPVSNWDIPTLAGAGAIRSTVSDQLTFLAVNLGLKKSPLNEALQKTHTKRAPVSKNMEIALGWHIQKQHTPEIIWHNGGTGGYRTFIGFDKQNGVGVAVLSNTSNSVDDIGFHLLNAQNELSKPRPKRTEIDLEPTVFDAYVGEYDLTSSVKFTISRQDKKFFVQLTGQNRIQMYPESENEFFIKVVNAQITFHKNDKNQVTHLILHQNGIKQRAVKKGMTMVLEQKETKLSAEILSRYVGRYELQSGISITITRENTQLKAQASGQPAVEIFPETETKFFYKAVDAQITFTRNEAKETISLTLHQAGRNMPAKKVE